MGFLLSNYIVRLILEFHEEEESLLRSIPEAMDAGGEEWEGVVLKCEGC